MKTIAYLRVSTGGQDLDSQRLAILDYAHRHRLHVDDFVEVTVSSRKTLKERGMEGLCAGMKAGDLLLVSELSRLGRSVGQIIQIVDDLVKNQIRLVAIKEDIRLDGQQDIQSKVMVTLFGLFAEIERDLISERTREGLAAAKAKGHLAGRPAEGFARPVPARWQGSGNQDVAWQAGIEGIDCQDHGRVAFDAAPLHPVAGVSQGLTVIRRSR